MPSLPLSFSCSLVKTLVFNIYIHSPFSLPPSLPPPPAIQSGDTEVLLEDGSRSVFYYIQLLHCRQLQQRPTDKLRRVWDSSYTLVYQERGAGTGKGWSTQFVSRHLGSERLPKGDVIQYLQKRAKVNINVVLLGEKYDVIVSKKGSM